MRTNIPKGSLTCKVPLSKVSRRGRLSKVKPKLPPFQESEISLLDVDMARMPMALRLNPFPATLIEQGVFSILHDLKIFQPSSDEVMFITILKQHGWAASIYLATQGKWKCRRPLIALVSAIISLPTLPQSTGDRSTPAS